MLEYLLSFLWGEPSLSVPEKVFQEILKKLKEQEDLNNLCCFEHRESQIRLMNLERTVQDLKPKPQSILHSFLSKLWNWLFGQNSKDSTCEQRLTAIETTLGELVKFQKDRDEISAKFYEPFPATDQDQTEGTAYIRYPAHSSGSRRSRRFQRNEAARCQFMDDRYMGPSHNDVNNFNRYEDCDLPFPYGNYNGDYDERYWNFSDRYGYPGYDYDEGYWTVGGFEEDLEAFDEDGPFNDEFIGNRSWNWCDHDGNALYPEFLYEEDETRDGVQEPRRIPSTVPIPPSDLGLIPSPPAIRSTPYSDGKRKSLIVENVEEEKQASSRAKTVLSSPSIHPEARGLISFLRKLCCLILKAILNL